MVHAFREQVLLEKIRALPEERFEEVEDFIDFLHERDADRHLMRSAAQLSESALGKVWDNPDDADYDRL